MVSQQDTGSSSTIHYQHRFVSMFHGRMWARCELGGGLKGEGGLEQATHNMGWCPTQAVLLQLQHSRWAPLQLLHTALGVILNMCGLSWCALQVPPPVVWRSAAACGSGACPGLWAQAAAAGRAVWCSGCCRAEAAASGAQGDRAQRWRDNGAFCPEPILSAATSVLQRAQVDLLYGQQARQRQWIARTGLF